MLETTQKSILYGRLHDMLDDIGPYPTNTIINLIRNYQILTILIKNRKQDTQVVPQPSLQ